MKIIFLDIDGVLNSTEYYTTIDRKNEDWDRFNPQAVEYIKKLCDEFSARIVISSTWRFGARQQLKNEMIKSGLIKHLHKDWKTPQLISQHRGEEINAWLKKHSDINNYVILDDDEEMLNEQQPNFVQTKLLIGMQEEHYTKAKEIFGNDTAR
jgi:hypothetical protein